LFDILFSQLGIKPDQIQEMAQRVVKGVDNIERRLQRIEAKLGITEPLEGAENDGQS
jgi:predicted transcriptional regulator